MVADHPAFARSVAKIERGKMSARQQFRHHTAFANDVLPYRGLPDIAIVVIGRNEGQRLLDCLVSIGPFARRTVYVDSGSEDGSPAAARCMNVHVVDLDMGQPFTAARARNAGYCAAKKLWPCLKFVQFVDGDCMVDAAWLETAWRSMQAWPEAAIVFGRRRERNCNHSVYNALCDREWDGVAGRSLECGGDAFVRTRAFEDAGMYRSSLIAGEEPELCVRLRSKGWTVWRLDCEMTLHDANMTTLRQWWLRNRRAGYAFAEVSILHWRSPHGIWRRSLLRSVGWGGALPLAAAAGFAHPAAFALLALYPAQVVRIAAHEKFHGAGWRNGFFDVLGKFAEFHGVATWFANRLIGRHQKIIEYK